MNDALAYAGAHGLGWGTVAVVVGLSLPYGYLVRRFVRAHPVALAIVSMANFSAFLFAVSLSRAIAGRGDADGPASWWYLALFALWTTAGMAGYHLAILREGRR
jgi:hypothetical protein